MMTEERDAAARPPSTSVEKRACRWWEPHRWTAWSDPLPGQERLGNGPWQEIQIQKRHCERCREIQLRHAS